MFFYLSKLFFLTLALKINLCLAKTTKIIVTELLEYKVTIIAFSKLIGQYLAPQLLIYE